MEINQAAIYALEAVGIVFLGWLVGRMTATAWRSTNRRRRFQNDPQSELKMVGAMTKNDA